MNKKLSGIIGIILSILLLVYFEPYTYKLLSLLNINIYNYSNTVRMIIDIVIKLVMCFIIYLLYKKDFKHSRKDSNIFKNVLIMLVSLICLVFDKKLDIYLVIKIIKDYIITPFIYCSIILLSVDKICRRNDTFILLSGLLASICHALTLSGTLTYVIINSLSTFILFIILSLLYRKSNSIWFSIVLYGLYLVSNIIILKYIGW